MLAVSRSREAKGSIHENSTGALPNRIVMVDKAAATSLRETDSASKGFPAIDPALSELSRNLRGLKSGLRGWPNNSAESLHTRHLPDQWSCVFNLSRVLYMSLALFPPLQLQDCTTDRSRLGGGVTMILAPTAESEVKGRKRVRWPFGRAADVGGGWQARSPLTEKTLRLFSVMCRKCRASSFVRLIT
jgi:hypothetical protein